MSTATEFDFISSYMAPEIIFKTHKKIDWTYRKLYLQSRSSYGFRSQDLETQLRHRD